MIARPGFNLQIAVLIDEFGYVAGLVTLEDLVEEIVGEVRDEHDTDETTPHHDTDGSWVMPGGVRPDEATDLIGVPVPESEDYDTLAGLILVTLGRLARVGDRVTVPTAVMPGSRAAIAGRIGHVHGWRDLRRRVA